MNNRSRLLEVVLIPLAIANLFSSIYLEPARTSAVAAPQVSTAEIPQSAGNKCECPKTPPPQ